MKGSSLVPPALSPCLDPQAPDPPKRRLKARGPKGGEGFGGNGREGRLAVEEAGQTPAVLFQRHQIQFVGEIVIQAQLGVG